MVNTLTCSMGQMLFILGSVACTSHWPPLSPSFPHAYSCNNRWRLSCAPSLIKDYNGFLIPHV